MAKCKKNIRGDVFISRSIAVNFRKDLIKQGWKKVGKVKKVRGCMPYTNIPRNYWKV